MAGFSLENQISTLSYLGITLNDGVTEQDLLSHYSRSEYEKSPFDLILFVLAGEINSKPYDRHFSNDIWNMDTECITGNGSYVSVIKNLIRITGYPNLLDSLSDNIDIAKSNGTVSYKCDGVLKNIKVKIKGDWIDPNFMKEIITDINRLTPNNLMLWGINNGQAMLLLFLSIADAQKISELTKKNIVVMR